MWLDDASCRSVTFLCLTREHRLHIVGYCKGVEKLDDHYRMRLKIGAHEFEAEGPVAVVQEQVKRFMDLIGSLPLDVVVNPYYEKNPASPASKPATPETDSTLDRIMRVEERAVSLTARPRNVDDTVLLLLYGQKILRQNDAVTGAEVMAGITATGGFAVSRVDRLLEKLARDGDVIVVGEHRSKTYRLTNAGLAKARQVAADLLAIVA
jgi:hypothetical protein